ncbi:TonB-dependent receptor plug domain-containing protein [Shewanella fidelis]|uniref:TonB-dependent receptor n=1 Tax=Shewanella fidelis TaxID=173509 RepID=A0AAW8NKX1_9GAMM|nr:TonB-dependent receptor [Shewanella fidelis]MDR8523420.1 TonB-dependent receptor [Shewanella fidelis]MDW4813346.1 TonB-dependent receptor [Shewanella fidelis]MDW4817282.1 TonB-dependent receptor [Shewanella fidelis]MDW4821361.1 TonB-dependent receptor [Shewanella fidelis]MDW4824561.1 TonB-dependent receptor [Shewanella fidelis]
MALNSRLAKAIRFALATGAATAALSSPVVLAADDENVERIQVTGSRIQRSDMETATPVTVLSADEMAKQGFTSVQDALESLTSTTGAMTTQSVHGFTPAASSISLRGAGANRTLTLINGKRLNQYPKPAGGTDNFVDTANLPMEAVQRIEILQSGGSAIYGADAVGGVINIILKKDFEGVALKYRHGDTSNGGGANDRIALSIGASSDKGNVSSFIEFTDNESLLATDRDNFGLHTDKVPHSQYSQYSSYGARIAGTGSGARQLTPQECTDGGFLWDEARNICGFDRSAWRDLQPESTRFISSTNFNYELAEDMTFVGRLDFAEAKSITNIEPSAIDDYDITVAGDKLTVSYGQEGKDGYMSKEFDKSTGLGGDFANAEDGSYYYARRLHELGHRSTETKTRNYFFTAGLEGLIADEYNWDASVNYGRTSVDVFGSGNATVGGMFNYITAGENGNSLLENMSAEDAEKASYSSFERAQSTQKNIQANITGSLFEMDAGDAMFAFGAEYTIQDYETDSDSESKNGNILGKGGSSGAGERKNWATYAEVSIPVLDDLTIDAALRYDHYDNFGGNLSPQIAVEYRPVRELLVRGSWSSVFRAPDMHRVYGDPTDGFTTVIDFKQCAAMGGTPGTVYPDEELNAVCNELHIDTTTGANEDLDAETGYTANIGAVWGGDAFDASFDLWEWKLDDMVSDISASQAARDYELYEDMITRDENGTITHVNAVAQNLAYQKVRGLDLTAGYTWDLNSFGELKLNFSGTYILNSEYQLTSTDPVEDDIDNGGLPQYRANLILGYFIEDFEATLGAYHTARMHGVQYKSFKEAAEANGDVFIEEDHEVASQTKWNLTAGYTISESIKLKAGIINLFDAGPNFDPTDTQWPHYPRGIYNARGQEYFIEGEVKF